MSLTPPRPAARLGRSAALLLFASQFALIELSLGALGPIHEAWPRLLCSAASTALWLGLAIVCRDLLSKALLSLLSATMLVSLVAFFARYRTFFDERTLRATVRYWGDIKPVLSTMLPSLVAVAGAVASIEFGLLSLAQGAAPRRRRGPLAWAIAAPLLLVTGPVTADLRLLTSARALRKHDGPAAATAISVPAAQTQRGHVPNVLLVITESVRADSYCSSPDPSCTATPAVNALLPSRQPLLEMRAIDSFTVISMATLSTGRVQSVTRDEHLSMPTFFELAKAVRHGDTRVHTAYWSAHCDPVFERASIKDSIDSYVTIETLFGDQGWHDDADQKLLERFARDVGTLPQPFFVVLQLIGTHTPYAIDPDVTPFKPFERVFGFEGVPLLRNTYRNSIARQDRQLATALKTLVDSPTWNDTVVFFTSDHGEEFGEHKQLQHGQDIFDEQIKVPAWVDGGGLSGAQRAALAQNQRAFVTHLDVLPTLLDAWGVLDSYDLAPVTLKLWGRSLLRPVRPMRAAIPLTNCSETFPCPFDNWGMMRDDLKLEAQPWDAYWNCWRMGNGQEHLVPPTDPDCKALAEASRSWFSTMPNGKPNVAQR